MAYIIWMIVGILIGAGSAFAIVFEKYRSLRKQKQEQDAQERFNKSRRHELDSEAVSLRAEREKFHSAKAEFDSRVIAFDELADENEVLKRDLQNIDVNLRKLQLDRDLQQ